VLSSQYTVFGFCHFTKSKNQDGKIKNILYMYMQDIKEVRRFTINELDKAYNDTRDLVNGLVKKSKPGDILTLVQLKLNKLELYINTLKVLDAAQQKGGRKTRKNRQQSKRHTK